MEYLSVIQYAEKHGISERTVRNYCASGKMEGACLTGKTWNIPADAPLPKKNKQKRPPLLSRLIEEKECRLKGGIYHRTQIDLTYNSNHIEGSRLTKEQTRYRYSGDRQPLPLHRLYPRPCFREDNRGAHQTPAWIAENQYLRQPKGLVCSRRLQTTGKRGGR